MISKEQLDKFKLIYKKEFNKEISDQEASEEANKLLRLVEIIYRPLLNSEEKENGNS